MSMKLRGALSLGVLLGIFSVGQAQADNAAPVTDSNADSPYVAAQYAREVIPDHERHSAEGNGYQLTFGLPLSFLPQAFYLPNTSLEGSFYAAGRKRDIDGSKDYQQALMFNLVHDFGMFGWSGDFTGKYLPKFQPFALAGLGAAREDVRGSRKFHPAVDAGGGLLFPLPWFGMSVRTEALAQLQQNRKSVPGQNVLVDYRLMVGLQIPLTPLFEEFHLMNNARTTCEVAVVDLQGMRTDCTADSDHDGVPDYKDLCPGTPPGVKVDATGCPLNNAEQDSDGDGVPDSLDLCPNTQKGLKVDANGCAVDQVISLPEVQFDLNAATLTDASKTILDGAARGLNGQKNLKVEISGYTDSSGSKDYNLKLSKERAESVRQYLISKGVEADRMTTMGYGEAEPKQSNKSAEGRGQNRRVEFKITHK